MSDPGRLTRRNLIGGTLLLASGGVVLSSIGLRTGVAQDTAEHGVPMDRGDAARTGVMSSSALSPTGVFEVLWSLETGSPILTSPVSSGDIAVVGCSDGRVLAVEISTGNVIWESTEVGPVRSSPALVDGVVYVGDTRGFITAIDLESSRQRWQTPLPGAVFSSPAVVGDSLYVSTRAGTAHALRRSSGRELWRFDFSGNADSSPALAEDLLVICTSTGVVHAISVDSGTEYWRFTSGAPIRTTPAIADGTVITGNDDGTVNAIRLSDGAELWRFGAQGPVEASPAAHLGMAYIGSNAGQVHAINLQTGVEVWHAPIRATRITSPVVAGTCAYVGGDDDAVRAIDLYSGETDWTVDLGAPISTSLIITDNILLAGTDSGNMFAVGEVPVLLEEGTNAEVTTPTVLRGAPALSAVDRGTLDTGTIVELGGPSEASGAITWWPVTVLDTGEQGWVEEAHLRPIPGDLPATNGSLEAGSSVVVTVDGLTLRAEPRLASVIVQTLTQTDVMALQSGVSEQDGYNWREVVVQESGLVGFLPDRFIAIAPPDTGNVILPANGGTPEPHEILVSGFDIGFDPTQIEIPAHTDVTLRLTNNGVLEHDLVIENTDYATGLLGNGESVDLVVNLSAGTYGFYCSVAGHREVGMEGTLSVIRDLVATSPVIERPPDSQEIIVSAIELAFEPNEIEIPAHTDVTLTVVNDGVLDHDLVIEELQIASDLLSSGESQSIVVNAAPGIYDFHCTVAGHSAAGMTGRLNAV